MVVAVGNERAHGLRRGEFDEGAADAADDVQALVGVKQAAEEFVDDEAVWASRDDVGGLYPAPALLQGIGIGRGGRGGDEGDHGWRARLVGVVAAVVVQSEHRGVAFADGFNVAEVGGEALLPGGDVKRRRRGVVAFEEVEFGLQTGFVGEGHGVFPGSFCLRRVLYVHHGKASPPCVVHGGLQDVEDAGVVAAAVEGAEAVVEVGGIFADEVLRMVDAEAAQVLRAGGADVGQVGDTNPRN